jgi:ribosomal-protein-alanine N-acetyltransferase
MGKGHAGAGRPGFSRCVTAGSERFARGERTLIISVRAALKVATQTLGAKFSIRDYRPTDLETLWKIDQRCFPVGIAYDRPELSDFVTQGNAISLVAEFDNDPAGGGPEADATPRIAGFAVAHAVRQKYGRILTLDIVPEARRYGLGTQLMLGCEARLRASGCREVYLETAVDNEPALRLYRKLGYEVLEVLPEYYASYELDAFRMRKRLSKNEQGAL